MRDKRYPCHKAVKQALLGWAAKGGPYYSDDELHEGLGRALGATPALQAEQFKLGKGQGIWQNLVAHGLKAHTTTEAHLRDDNGCYHLTPKGKDMARKLLLLDKYVL